MNSLAHLIVGLQTTWPYLWALVFFAAYPIVTSIMWITTAWLFRLRWEDTDPPPPPLPGGWPTVTVLVPAHNEEANLEDFVRALAQAAGRLTPEFEIIIVNDATHAVALRLAQDLPVRYLALSRNFGK